jgi:predicted amidohydrolase
MMRYAGLFFCARFSRSDAELAIHGNGIAVNNFAMKTGGEFQRYCRLAAAGRAKNHNQQRIARQLARAPVNVVPVASDGDGENKNDDYDQADILQPLVRRRRIVRALVLALVQCGHDVIVVELQAADCVGGISAQATPELKNESLEYRSNLEQLKQLLPDFQVRLLAEKSRLEVAKSHVAAAAAWAGASTTTF